jgi:malonyl-CoA O-methyltransferase
MSEIRKSVIARAFSAAASGYDAAALVQRRVAARLADSLAQPQLAAGARAVEIGCGTGLLTGKLLAAHPEADWLITDIAPAMVERTAARWPGRAAFRVMDGEAPDLAPGSCDLIVSSLAMQWFTDLGQGISQLVACLKPGGRLAFATLGAHTFTEWRAAHVALGLSSGSLRFPSAAEVQALWPAGGVGTVREKRVAAWHRDGQDFVRSLKAIGAHLPQPGHRPLPAGAFRRVLRHFGAGCPATYHVLYACYVKDGS